MLNDDTVTTATPTCFICELTETYLS